jgi:hypothetical protein
LLLLWFTTLALARTTSAGAIPPAYFGTVVSLSVLVALSFNLICQAIILHVAFENMRNRSASIAEAMRVGLRRFFPLLVLGIGIGILMMLVLSGLSAATSAALPLMSANAISRVAAPIVAGLLGFAAIAILYTTWFVAAAACIADRRGPFSALRRSAQLTKGHRWRIMGLTLLLFIVLVIIRLLLSPPGGTIVTFLSHLTLSAVWGAFYAIVIAVCYHDLRVAKEGVDIEQIASVFD